MGIPTSKDIKNLSRHTLIYFIRDELERLQQNVTIYRNSLFDAADREPDNGALEGALDEIERRMTIAENKKKD